MSELRQYFETDFSNCVRVQIEFPFSGGTQKAVLLYDFNGFQAFLAIYIESKNYSLALFKELMETLEYGKTEISLGQSVTLPSAKSFPGTLSVRNQNQFEIQAQFFGDPEWISSNSIQSSRRIFLYSETNLKVEELFELKKYAKTLGHQLQFRSLEYRDRRTQMEKPLAFISHDSRDKESVARNIAIGLQKMLCPVWYDEYSLNVGDNLRESIEKGIKECKKCVLILSPNFISNNGWTKKEFDSIFTREIIEEKQLVLPVWFNVTKNQVYEYCPSLLNVMALVWENLGESEVCRRLNLAINSRE